MMKIFAISICLCLLFTSCTTTSRVENFNKIKTTHKTVAILPAITHFVLDSAEVKKISKSRIEESEKQLSFMVQNEINNSFIKKKKIYSVIIQDIKKTNSLLFADGKSFEEYKTIGKDSLAKIIGVDIVLVSNIKLSKKFSDTNYDLLLAFGITPPGVGSKFKVVLNSSVVAKSAPTVLWQKEYNPTGKIDEDLLVILGRMIRTVAIDFPYQK